MTGLVLSLNLVHLDCSSHTKGKEKVIHQSVRCQTFGETEY